MVRAAHFVPAERNRLKGDPGGEKPGKRGVQANESGCKPWKIYCSKAEGNAYDGKK